MVALNMCCRAVCVLSVRWPTSFCYYLVPPSHCFCVGCSDAVLLAATLFFVFAGAVIARNAWRLGHIKSPPSVPMLGHIPWIVFGKPWQKFHSWAQTYGSLYKMYARWRVGWCAATPQLFWPRTHPV